MILLNALLARLSALNAYRNSIFDLASLDDRALSEMGFSRPQIARISRLIVKGS